MLSRLWWVFGPMGQKVHRPPFTANVQTYYRYTEILFQFLIFSNLYFILYIYIWIEIFFTFSKHYNWRMKNKKITHIFILRHIHLPYDSCVRGIRKMWYVNASRKHLCFLRSFLSVRKKNGRGFLMQRSTHI